MLLIGRGSYGDVYHATCAGQDVAVKVLLMQPNTAEDIKREVKLQRECNSEKIIKLLDAFEVKKSTGTDVWVVMELCHAGSTLDVMRQQGKPFTEQQLVWVVAEALRGLDYLHTERKAIHRDIKVAN